MSIQRETYHELLHAMMFALVKQELNFVQVGSVLWAAAQPDTEETTHCVTHKVRERLTDWSESDKGMLIGVETVLMTFRCGNIHGPCTKGQHTVAMTRVIGHQGWEPDNVSSSVNFNQAILDATMSLHPDKTGDKNVSSSNGSQRDLISAFREMFMQQEPEKSIEKEIDQFRAELDKLFPSTPGKEEGT